ncbi:MAG TPA: hypothetical protein VL331_05765, partial [Croceibacterium sp.]|nr:hypothetical protein [Croceibacterium sp.]
MVGIPSAFVAAAATLAPGPIVAIAARAPITITAAVPSVPVASAAAVAVAPRAAIAVAAGAAVATRLARRAGVGQLFAGFLVDQPHRQADLAARVDLEDLDLHF